MGCGLGAFWGKERQAQGGGSRGRGSGFYVPRGCHSLAGASQQPLLVGFGASGRRGVISTYQVGYGDGSAFHDSTEPPPWRR
jgi:hypothetical protein